MKHQIRNTFVALVAAGSAASFAATNSTSGDSIVTLEIAKHIQLVGLEDIDLGTADAATDGVLSGSDAFCVGGTGFATFKIAIAGATTGSDTSAFYLDEQSTGLDTIPYSVAFANAADGTGAAGVSNGVEYTGFSRQIADCGNAGDNDNAQLAVSVADGDWQNAQGTTYQDTLTVTVSAE